jgi:hypothetical protein
LVALIARVRALRRVLAPLATAVPRLGWPDVLIPTGLGCLVYGVARIWVPLAWIVGGLVLTLAGLMVARAERKRGRA